MTCGWRSSNVNEQWSQQGPELTDMITCLGRRAGDDEDFEQLQRPKYLWSDHHPPEHFPPPMLPPSLDKRYKRYMIMPIRLSSRRPSIQLPSPAYIPVLQNTAPTSRLPCPLPTPPPPHRPCPGPTFSCVLPDTKTLGLGRDDEEEEE
jgi:hypothetical protein